MPLRIDFVTIFPNMFAPLLAEGVIARGGHLVMTSPQGRRYVVGGLNASFSGTTSYLMPVPDEEGLPFESSLSITIGNNAAGAALIAHAYKLL